MNVIVNITLRKQKSKVALMNIYYIEQMNLAKELNSNLDSDISELKK